MFAIAGVTGRTGKVAAETLLAEGEKVRVLVREAYRGAPWRSRGAEVAVASLEEEAGLAKALSGVEGAYLLLPPLFDTGDALGANAARTLVLGRAIAAAEVPHVVFLSSVGAQHDCGTGPIKGLHRAEQALPQLAPKTAFTWLRPAYFAENVGGVVPVAKEHGVLPAMLDPTKRIAMIATADIGRAATQELVAGPREGGASILEIAGPREASFDDLAAELASILGPTGVDQAGAPRRAPGPDTAERRTYPFPDGRFVRRGAQPRPLGRLDVPADRGESCALPGPRAPAPGARKRQLYGRHVHAAFRVRRRPGASRARRSAAVRARGRRRIGAGSRAPARPGARPAHGRAAGERQRAQRKGRAAGARGPGRSRRRGQPTRSLRLRQRVLALGPGAPDLRTRGQTATLALGGRHRSPQGRQPRDRPGHSAPLARGGCRPRARRR